MSQIAVSRENSIGNFSIPDTQSDNNNNNHNVNIPEEKQDEQSKSTKSQPPVPQGIAAPSTSTAVNMTKNQSEGEALIEEVKQLAVKLRAEGNDNKKFSTIKGSEELLKRIDEVFVELEEQYSKIVQAMKTSRSVVENLGLLKAAMEEIEQFYQAVKNAWMFMTKSRLKLRMQNCYQTLRARCTQLLTAVTLELLPSLNKPPEETPMLGSELFHTGLYYFHGVHGKPKNYIFAFEKFIQGAEFGDSECMYMAAKCYLNGHGVEENTSIGLKWLEKAANIGKCAHAKTEFANQIIAKLKLENKLAVKQFFQMETRRKSMDESMLLENDINNKNRKSMDLDDLDAEEEDQLIQHDMQYAMKLLLQAASEGHIEAKTALGSLYEEAEDYEQAAKWYSLASNGGCSRGTCLLGNLLLFSKTNFVGTRQKAFSLFSMAARNGQSEAFNGLGLCYESGIGIEMNLITALFHYRTGAKLGSCQAMYNLGYLLVKNAIEIMDEAKINPKLNRSASAGGVLEVGIPSSPSNRVGNDDDLFSELGIRVEDALREGIHWLRAASENQIPAAAFQLGRLYEQNIGVPFDEQAALSNYLYAAKLNHGRSALFAANLLYKLSSDIDSPFYTKNMLRVAKLYKQAALSGEVEAMNSLGLMLEDGRAVGSGVRDVYAAASWYYEACKNKYLPAFLNLALLLASESIYSFPSLQDEMITLDQALQFLEDRLPPEIDQDRLDSFQAFFTSARERAKMPVLTNVAESSEGLVTDPDHPMVSKVKPNLHAFSHPSHHPYLHPADENDYDYEYDRPNPRDAPADYDRIKKNVDKWKNKIQKQQQQGLIVRTSSNEAVAHLPHESQSLVLAENTQNALKKNVSKSYLNGDHLNSNRVSSDNVGIFHPQNYYKQKSMELFVTNNSSPPRRTGSSSGQNSPEYRRAQSQGQMNSNNNNNNNGPGPRRQVSFPSSAVPHAQINGNNNNNYNSQPRQYVDVSFSAPLRPSQQLQEDRVVTVSNSSNNLVLKSGELYVTNGAIPPPLYVPKALPPERPSSVTKPDLPAKSHAHQSLYFPTEVNFQQQQTDRRSSFPPPEPPLPSSANTSDKPKKPKEYSPKRKETVSSGSTGLWDPHANAQDGAGHEEKGSEALAVDQPKKSIGASLWGKLYKQSKDTGRSNSNQIFVPPPDDVEEIDEPQLRQRDQRALKVSGQQHTRNQAHRELLNRSYDVGEMSVNLPDLN